MLVVISIVGTLIITVVVVGWASRIAEKDGAGQIALPLILGAGALVASGSFFGIVTVFGGEAIMEADGKEPVKVTTRYQLEPLIPDEYIRYVNSTSHDRTEIQYKYEVDGRIVTRNVNIDDAHVVESGTKNYVEQTVSFDSNGWVSLGEILTKREYVFYVPEGTSVALPDENY